jgi:hypothetical protein
MRVFILCGEIGKKFGEGNGFLNYKKYSKIMYLLSHNVCFPSFVSCFITHYSHTVSVVLVPTKYVTSFEFPGILGGGGGECDSLTYISNHRLL